MSKVRVGVLRGGPSSEYEVSLKTGASVLESLGVNYRPVDLLVTREGSWFCGGLPTDLVSLSRQVEVVINALHGRFGEDGQVQKVLDRVMIPYSGSGPLSSAIGINKILTKRSLSGLPVRMPYGLHLNLSSDKQELAEHVFRRLSPPWVLKPIDQGSSCGVAVVDNFSDLVATLEEGARVFDELLVEEYIFGREATVGVVEKFRGHHHYTLPVVEVKLPLNSRFFDYNTKYAISNDNVCPGRFTEEEKTFLQTMAVAVHQKLGLRHYSRSDFVVTSRGVYFLEVNTLPGLMPHSLFSQSLEAVGCSRTQFLDHLVKLIKNKV